MAGDKKGVKQMRTSILFELIAANNVGETSYHLVKSGKYYFILKDEIILDSQKENIPWSSTELQQAKDMFKALVNWQKRELSKAKEDNLMNNQEINYERRIGDLAEKYDTSRSVINCAFKAFYSAAADSQEAAELCRRFPNGSTLKEAIEYFAAKYPPQIHGYKVFLKPDKKEVACGFLRATDDADLIAEKGRIIRQTAQMFDKDITEFSIETDWQIEFRRFYMTTEEHKENAKPTREDVEKLKSSWLNDPCWDIECTEGFEDYAEELSAFHDKIREEREAKWQAEASQRLVQRIHAESMASAFPYRSRWDSGKESEDCAETGITKREYFAAMAMQGWCSNSHEHASWNPQNIAESAVACADALIAELNKSE